MAAVESEKLRIFMMILLHTSLQAGRQADDRRRAVDVVVRQTRKFYPARTQRKQRKTSKQEVLLWGRENCVAITVTDVAPRRHPLAVEGQQGWCDFVVFNVELFTTFVPFWSYHNSAARMARRDFENKTLPFNRVFVPILGLLSRAHF